MPMSFHCGEVRLRSFILSSRSQTPQSSAHRLLLGSSNLFRIQIYESSFSVFGGGAFLYGACWCLLVLVGAVGACWCCWCSQVCLRCVSGVFLVYFWCLFCCFFSVVSSLLSLLCSTAVCSSIRDTRFFLLNGVSQAGCRLLPPFLLRDTWFLARKSVSRRRLCNFLCVISRDTRFFLRKGVSQAECGLLHPFLLRDTWFLV